MYRVTITDTNQWTRHLEGVQGEFEDLADAVAFAKEVCGWDALFGDMTCVSVVDGDDNMVLDAAGEVLFCETT